MTRWISPYFVRFPSASNTSELADSGMGMDAVTQAQIFEPFFTTKDPGRGTGLGLSTCYGIAKQAERFISVESQVGQGTTFNVLLPRTEAPAERRSLVRDPENVLGSEVILIAEDDEQVRKIAARSLSLLGYSSFAPSGPRSPSSS